MRQGVRDLYFRALPFVPMVFQYEVYHRRAVGLEVTVFVVQRRVYLASSLLRFVGVVVGALLDEDIQCPVLRGTLPVRHGLGRLGECRDGRGKWGFSDRGHHASVCWEVTVYCEHLWLFGVVGVREGQRERLIDLGYRLRMYCSGVVPEGVLGGVPVVRAVRPAGSIVCGVRVSSRVPSSRRLASAAQLVCHSVSVGLFSAQSRV